MNSFDVTYLFTNNPLDETIYIILDQLFADNRFCEAFFPETDQWNSEDITKR